MSNSAVCQDFVQNAWKKDLCSNCFKTKSDHQQHSAPGDAVSRTSSKLHGCQLDVHKQQNGFGRMKTRPKTNGNVSGVHLWEVGDSARPSTNRDVKGILKCRHKNNRNNNNNNGETRGSGNCKAATGRRSSVVGFSEDTPQVIGYGGNDYEWDGDDDEASSEEEPSDVDSLENFDLSLEEKAFGELTDSNTQYNADNLNLINEIKLNRSVVVTNGKQTSVVSKLNTQTSYFVPSSATNEKDVNSINDARSFIRSSLYGESGDFGSSLGDVETAEDVSVTVTKRESDKIKVVIKPGCDTAPSATGRRPVVRPSVKDLFNKEEPVTAAEFAAVTHSKCHANGNGVCSPYGIVPVTSVSSNIEISADETPPTVLSSPPPSDAVTTCEKRPQTLSLETNNNENILGSDDLMESIDKVLQKRKYEMVAKSCHYASANVSDGVATPPLLSTATTSVSTTPQYSSSLPPTPLTSPYSSTSILKGIPVCTEDTSNRTKPLVTKPKPKIPAKPTHLGSPTSPSPEPPVVKKEINVTVDSPSLDTTSLGLPDQTDSNSEVSKCSGPGSIDSGKRSTKRPAPRPPSEPPPLTRSEEVKVLLNPEEESSAEIAEKNEIPVSLEPPTKTELKTGSVNGSTPSLNDESLGGNSVQYGVPSPVNNSVTTAMNGSRETPRDVGNKSKKSKFSLKKLLKFGSTREDHHTTEHRRSKSERRSKLDITHPIELIQTTRTDLDNVSAIPSSPDSSFGSNGSCSDRPILTKMTTFGSPPVSPGWVSGPLSPAKETTDQLVSPTTDNYPQEFPADALAPVEDQQQWKSCLATIINGNCKGNCKPQPPPRFRNLTNDEQHVTCTANKDKPVRPPPPNKLCISTTYENDVQDKDERNGEPDATDGSDNVQADDEQINEKGERNLNGILDYANLGDIRTSLVPQKPGRWPSGSVMEMSDDVTVNDAYNNGHHVEKFGESEVTYYAPPNELVDLECEELYADQAIAVPSTESSQLSSLTSESTSSSSQFAKNYSDTSDDRAKSNNESESPTAGIKIYERVILKKGGLEKVFASSPTVLSPSGEQPNGNGALNDAADEMSDMGALLWPRRKSTRLSLRKIKTVVHKNLEDNYGAVVSANHQTLTQILEQVSLTHHATSSKAKILEDVALHWSDFSLLEDSQVTVVGQKAFYSAIWKQQNLETTLMMTPEAVCCPAPPTRNPCVMVPLAEFQHFIPDTYLAEPQHNSSSTIRGVIWVMERMRVETVFNVAENLQLLRDSDAEGYEREVCFILLQLINGLKHLQVLGIEEIEGDLSDFVLVMKGSDTNYRLVILPKSSTDAYNQSRSNQVKLSLGQGALLVMKLLFHPTSDETFRSFNETFSLIADILQQERADSLSQAKRLFEYLLWGPANLEARLSDSPPISDQEQTFQRWLDLERANVLNNLIRTQSLWQIRLTIFEEYMLSFFVRTCAKSLREASGQLQTTLAKLT